jgi:hypothetical protein
VSPSLHLKVERDPVSETLFSDYLQLHMIDNIYKPNDSEYRNGVNRNSVALDGNPEPDLVHATGWKQPTTNFNRKLFKSTAN